jgi:hypothetical protein
MKMLNKKLITNYYIIIQNILKKTQILVIDETSWAQVGYKNSSICIEILYHIPISFQHDI